MMVVLVALTMLRSASWYSAVPALLAREGVTGTESAPTRTAGLEMYIACIVAWYVLLACVAASLSNPMYGVGEGGLLILDAIYAQVLRHKTPIPN